MNKKDVNLGAIIFYVIISILVLFFSWHIIICYDAQTAEIKDVISAIFEGFKRIDAKPLNLYITPSFWSGMGYVLMVDVIIGFALFGIQRKTMFGREHGSARWSTKKEEKELADKDQEKNMIMTKEVQVSMNTRKTRLNNNITVVGGSGSGKTRFLAKPNILQCNCSYCITDPKGELLSSTGKVLEDEGYVVKVFNLIEKQHSCCYNPFVYIHKESDVFKLITQLIKNTNPPENKGGGDPFWEKSETALLEAIFFYLWLECPPEEQNFKSVMQLIDIAGASEDDENQESQLDVMFRLLEAEKGADYIPCKQYNIFKKASGKTAKGILISVGVRLSVFNLQEIADLTLTDNLKLNEIGDRKTVLYIVIPDSDGSFNFLVSMLYSQLFDELYFQADFGELKWQNNKVLFRSAESLVEKKNHLSELFEKYKRTEGNIKLESLRKEIIDCLKEIDNEFGIPFPEIKNKVTEKFINKHLDNIDSCLLRLRDKTATLATYLDEYTENYHEIRILSRKNQDVVARQLSKAIKKRASLELRLKREFGLEKEPIKTNIVQKILMKLSLWQYKDEAIHNQEKKFIKAMKLLLKEMQASESKYGTRQSFDDKYQKIVNLKKTIEHYEKQIKEASKEQTALKAKLKKKIIKAKEQISTIELLAQYEFGIKNLEKRMNGGRLPVHVRCILDEFANIAPIPDFAKLVATMRSREISVTIILQNISQLKEMYKDNWESITGNCDTFLFLGGQEQSTLEYVEKKLGEATIDKRTQGNSKGGQGSRSENWDNMARKLMNASEIGVMDGLNCILLIRGHYPYFCNKYPLEEHPRYSQMGETDNPNDPRLYKFKEKFNTTLVAEEINAGKFLMNGEFHKALENKMLKYIEKFDRNKNFETLKPEALNLIAKTNIISEDDEIFERNQIQMNKERVIKSIESQMGSVMTQLEANGQTFDDILQPELREIILNNILNDYSSYEQDLLRQSMIPQSSNKEETQPQNDSAFQNENQQTVNTVDEGHHSNNDETSQDVHREPVSNNTKTKVQTEEDVNNNIKSFEHSMEPFEQTDNTEGSDESTHSVETSSDEIEEEYEEEYEDDE